jgi:hypothetical protein
MSDSSSDEEADTTSTQITSLLSTLQADPQSYPSHIALLPLLRSTGDLPRLSLAREAFAAAFPLPESLWLEWISDSKRFGTPQETISLCKRSIADYVSVPLWKEYCVNVITAVFPEMIDEEDEGDVEMREAWLNEKSVKTVLSEAVIATRYHVGSNEVWGLYRDFMVHCLMSGKESVQAVREVYLERLAQSHVGMCLAYV